MSSMHIYMAIVNSADLKNSSEKVNSAGPENPYFDHVIDCLRKLETEVHALR